MAKKISNEMKHISEELVLHPTTMEQAVNNALNNIELESSGQQLGLYTRWPTFNRALKKYWRFNTITLGAGASGSGKSYLLNFIEDDFTNTQLNHNFYKDNQVLIAAFKYEMSASDEVIRTVSSKMGKSYSYLLSAEWDKTMKDYNTVSKTEIEAARDHMKSLVKRNILYFETAGNLQQLFETVKFLHQKYPNHRVVVTLDHTLLSERLNEKDDMELVKNTAKVAIAIKKRFGDIVIFLGQLNGYIEEDKRRDTPSLHYPVKRDIHGSNQIYWACDNVFIAHRPETLYIVTYGPDKLPTKNLMHVAFIKSRHGKIGNIWLHEDFANGIIAEKPIKDDGAVPKIKFG